MFNSPARKQKQALCLSAFVLVLATMACAGEISTELMPLIPTPEPTVEVTLDSIDPNYVLALPKEIKNRIGQTFIINRVEFFDSIETPDRRYIPERGVYLWLIGTIGNGSPKRECVRGQEFTLAEGAEQYQMRVEDAEVIYNLYNLPYPDFYMGYCLDAAQSADIFLIFDVSREAEDLWLNFGPGQGRLGGMAALMTATPKPIGAAPKRAALPASFAEAGPPALVTADRSNVNIRSGPGTQYQIIGTLLLGQSLEITGRNADSSWWQISTAGGSGWVAAKVTTASHVNETIPVR